MFQNHQTITDKKLVETQTLKALYNVLIQFDFHIQLKDI